MWRLSIFSFETLDLGGFRWRTVLAMALALFIVGAVCETGLRLAQPWGRHFTLTDFPFLLGERLYRLREARRAGETIDLLIMGDSIAELGLVPEVFERTLGKDLNAFSLSGAMPPGVLDMLAARLGGEIDVHPRVVVVAWSFYTFNDNSPFLIDFWKEYRSYRGIKELENRLAPIDHLYCWRYINVMREMIRRGPPFFRSADWVREDAGWMRFDQTYDELSQERREQIREIIAQNLESYEIHKETETRLASALSRLSEKTEDVTFILGAIHPDFNQLFPESLHAQWMVEDRILPIARANASRVMDFRGFEKLKRKHFLDMVHQNAPGARILSRTVAQRLRQAWRGRPWFENLKDAAPVQTPPKPGEENSP